MANYKHPSFNKILFSVSSSKLRIPVEFVKEYGEIFCHQAIIELVSDDESGKTWNVKMETIDDRIWFTNGWPEFVKDKQLAVIDFLVFKLIGKSTFQVAVYGKQGILKEPSSSSHFEGKYDQWEVKETTSFTVHLKKHRQYTVEFPKTFVDFTGMARANAVNLQNAKGEKWRINLITKKDGRICMTRGWKAFLDANGLSVGSGTCKFEFNPNSGNFILIETATNVSRVARKPKSRPSFFKAMTKDFTSHVRLPPVFVLKYGEKLAENTKLRTSSGETWNVGLEKMDEDNYFFTRGWNEFAKNVGVKWGEFLVFWFDISKSSFDVSVFGTNGCERKI